MLLCDLMNDALQTSIIYESLNVENLFGTWRDGSDNTRPVPFQLVPGHRFCLERKERLNKLGLGCAKFSSN